MKESELKEVTRNRQKANVAGGKVSSHFRTQHARDVRTEENRNRQVWQERKEMKGISVKCSPETPLVQSAKV
jgi:hypothetical protein